MSGKRIPEDWWVQQAGGMKEFNELREQLDRSNSSFRDMRQGSIPEARELEDQLTLLQRHDCRAESSGI